MLNRAHISLRAAFQFMGAKTRWNFLRGEMAPAAVIAPFSVTGVTASAGQVSAAAPAGHGLAVDDNVVAPCFIVGTRVSATAASGFGVFTAVITTGSNVFNVTVSRDMYDAPSDMRNGYSVRLLSSMRALRYIQRRSWDRAISDEFSAGTVEGYDFYQLGGRSKIRLIPPPGSADVLLQRYYRRFGLATSSASTTALDIPEDYEEVPISWAKWHFLTDKGEGRKDQATTWLSLAQDGLKSMLAEQTDLPDENLGWVPGNLPWAAGDRATRWLDWNYG
jgi:hypothetical protein